MIYNFVQYIVNNFSLITFTADGFMPNSADDAISIIDNGGTVDHYTGRSDINVQFLSRSKNKVTARQNIQSIFDFIKNRFGVTLPEATVNGETYPSVKAYAIVPIQAPGYIGADETNYEMYSFNVTVTFDYS